MKIGTFSSSKSRWKLYVSEEWKKGVWKMITFGSSVAKFLSSSIHYRVFNVTISHAPFSAHEYGNVLFSTHVLWKIIRVKKVQCSDRVDKKTTKIEKQKLLHSVLQKTKKDKTLNARWAFGNDKCWQHWETVNRNAFNRNEMVITLIFTRLNCS